MAYHQALLQEQRLSSVTGKCLLNLTPKIHAISPLPEPQHFEPVIAQPEPPPRVFENQKEAQSHPQIDAAVLMSLTFFAAIGMAGFYMFTRLQVDKPGPFDQRGYRV